MKLTNLFVMAVATSALLMSCGSGCSKGECAAAVQDGPATEFRKNQIRDLVLVYQGNENRRPKWTVEDFVPYVSHKFADGHRDWTFDGILMLEFEDEEKAQFCPTVGKMAGKDSWQWYLDRLYEEGKGLDALDKCIDSLKTVIGDPGFKHKVVLSIPTAMLVMDNWGELDGRKLDFTKHEEDGYADCVAATKWYVDQIVDRFNQHKYKNLDLTGLYWINEDFIHTKDLTSHVAPLVKEKGLEFVWIPYFEARGFSNWKDQGFDIAYMQPNYLFDNVSVARMKEAIDVSRHLNMAVELEMDANSLYDAENSNYSKFEEYLDYFDKMGVWDNSAIAYYTGTKGLILMAENPTPENQRIMDRMFSKIVERRSNPDLTSTK